MDERRPSIEKCIESLHSLVKEDVLLAIIDVFTFIDKQENKEVRICKKSKNTKHKIDFKHFPSVGNPGSLRSLTLVHIGA